MFIRRIIPITYFIALVGCNSTSRAKLASVDTNVSSQAQPTKMFHLSTICDLPKSPCTNILAPVKCEYRFTSQTDQSESTLFIWAPSQCEAKQKISNQFCQQNKPEIPYISIRCVPDSTLGNCPTLPITCNDAAKKTRCIAKSYYNHQIHPSLYLKADGTSECDAKNQLSEVACKKNLNPKYMSEVVCTQIKEDIIK